LENTSHFVFFLIKRGQFTPAAGIHGLWPWMDAPTFGRDVAPLGHQSGATGFVRGAPQASKGFAACMISLFSKISKSPAL